MRLSIYGHMLCFLNCHLAAHMNYAVQRVDEFEYILDSQDFDFSNTSHVLDHKLVYAIQINKKNHTYTHKQHVINFYKKYS